MEKIRDLGKDLRDGGRATHSITSNRGKEPIILDDVCDAPNPAPEWGVERGCHPS